MPKAPRKATWHAVSIIPGASACEAALALRGKRRLPLDAPRLPLPACGNQDQCQCRYQHHADRRGSPRRADERGTMNSAQRPAKERRRPGERRG